MICIYSPSHPQRSNDLADIAESRYLFYLQTFFSRPFVHDNSSTMSTRDADPAIVLVNCHPSEMLANTLDETQSARTSVVFHSVQRYSISLFPQVSVSDK